MYIILFQYNSLANTSIVYLWFRLSRTKRLQPSWQKRSPDLSGPTSKGWPWLWNIRDRPWLAFGASSLGTTKRISQTCTSWQWSPFCWSLLPIHTADCERSFSVQNTIVTKLRSRLSPLISERLMRIRIEGQGLTKHNFQSTIKRWRTAKHRILKSGTAVNTCRPTQGQWPESVSMCYQYYC